MAEPVCKPPRDVPRREVVPEERESLFEILKQVKDSGGWTPKKPDKTVYNFGHDVVTVRTHPPTGRGLPSGRWEKIFTLPAEYSPYIVHWKILVTDTPYIGCMSYMDGRPTSPRGIELKDLYDYGVWQPNDRVWCHVYDTVNHVYGLTFNVVEPLTGEYDFYVLNHDPDGAQHRLTYLYLSWYQWEKRRIVKVW